jgi:predicted ribosome quality control (RQC) complex YloA/Tae2 family protein
MDKTYLENMLANLQRQLQEHTTAILYTREQLREYEKNAEATNGAIQAVSHLIDMEKQNARLDTNEHKNLPDIGKARTIAVGTDTTETAKQPGKKP